jgi:glutamate synthase (NADPH/NADH) small chain
LAAAQQLTRAGHEVVVFERADKIGGLLRYGIPDFKMEKWVIDRRLEQMEAEGTEFRTNANVGVNVSVEELERDFDAIVLAGGATAWRDLPMPGRELNGIHQAMEYLPLSNQVQSGDLAAHPIDAYGKRVVIIGGGDTGADCLGTANRQGAVNVTQLEILPKPPPTRAESTPWPTWPLMHLTSSAHEEGVEQVYAISTTEFVGDENGTLSGIRTVDVKMEMVDGRMTFTPVAGSENEIPCELVFLAMGFVGPEREGMLTQLGVDLDERGNVKRDAEWATSKDNVYVCGDMGRGQSLIVWAISEGRACAAAVDRALMGDTQLPSPVTPTSAPIR